MDDFESKEGIIDTIDESSMFGIIFLVNAKIYGDFLTGLWFYEHELEIIN